MIQLFAMMSLFLLLGSNCNMLFGMDAAQKQLRDGIREHSVLKVQEALNAGADVNYTDQHNLSPLSLIFVHNAEHVLRILLDCDRLDSAHVSDVVNEQLRLMQSMQNAFPQFELITNNSGTRIIDLLQNYINPGLK